MIPQTGGPGPGKTLFGITFLLVVDYVDVERSGTDRGIDMLMAGAAVGDRL